jgi:hypothetical protein
MKIVPEELSNLLSSPEFCEFHNGCGAQFSVKVRQFLTATMDEVRLATSSRVALDILNTIGISDAAHFREAVLRRELSGNIAYSRQRDHSAHTLYNYLLGWYFFTHSPPLRKALTKEFEKRGVSKLDIKPFQNISATSAVSGNMLHCYMTSVTCLRVLAREWILKLPVSKQRSARGWPANISAAWSGSITVLILPLCGIGSSKVSAQSSALQRSRTPTLLGTSPTSCELSATWTACWQQLVQSSTELASPPIGSRSWMISRVKVLNFGRITTSASTVPTWLSGSVQREKFSMA